MKKAMLSQPMAGKTYEEIVATREKAMAALKEKGYEVIETLFTDECYSKEQMQKRGGCSDSSLLAFEIFGEHEFVPCSIFLQRLGKSKRLQDRT